MSDPTLDPETRALVDALLEAVDEVHITRAPLYDARDALRDHLKPNPLTVEEWSRQFCYDHGASPIIASVLAKHHRDLEAAIKRGEVVDDE